MLNKKIPAGREFFYATIELCDEFTASQTNTNLIARVNGDFVARNNFICYNLCSELVEDPCRKGLSFMKNQEDYTLKLTEDELRLLKTSVSYSLDSKRARLLELLEGCCDRSSHTLRETDSTRYEEYFDYLILSQKIDHELDEDNLPF